ncbi:MAG: CHAT domain-containing protein, partial [Bacteroidota bacterium]
MNTPPVILLAFANEKMEGRFLHTLKDEIAALRKALQPAEDAGLCEIVLLPNATTEEILDTFQRQRYRDRIALFHYGGHADGYQLLLESSQGHNEVAHGEGLVSFLGRQDSLQLVFLNGCATQQQSEELIQAGVPTVIGTYTAISDNLATMLASRFYSSLGQGQHLARAWEEAEDEVRLRYGSGTKRGLVFDDEEEAESYDGFPWNLLVRPGSEKVREWSLPAAVNNHLFGLPEVPIRDLPEIPFRFLQRYTFEEAALFFGRGRYIRTLYTRLLDTHAAPITLFYGQSGVGKSSLLDAGLLPRLEKEAHVIYLRRDHTLGLTGTLAQAFEEIPQKQGAEPLSEADLHKLEDNLTQLRNTESQLTGASKVQVGLLIEELEEKIKASKPQHRDQKVDTSDFLAAWHHFEAQVGKPYIIILDQVEEVFYRANHNQPAELEDFLHVLGHIFGIPQARPSGKIILAYRKEYHPEILEFCKDAGLPREEVFLKQLGRDDIAEVILGIGSTPRLRSTYRVQVEPELPYIIADDLLVDRDSPIAPVLQIVLTKLWQLTENDEVRNFTVAKYQELQREGILLDSFYYQQMDKLQAQHPQLESSGLALDMLAYHTTVMGTSNAKADVEIKARYDQRPEASLLLKSFKSLYLLSDTGGIMTSLAHDTLAPLVRKEFQQSGRPGQRASIILENKLLAYSKDPETVLDPADLATVEAGKLGMAAWKGDSLKLIEASRKHRDKLQQVRQRNLMGFGAMGLVLLVVAFFFYRSVQESQETEQYLTELNDSRVLTAKAAGLSSIDRSQAIRVAEMACEKGGVIVYEAEAKLQEIYNQGAAFPFYRRVIDLAENELPDPIFLEKMTLSPLKNHLLLFYVDSTDTRTGIVYDLIQETVAKRITGFRAACWTDNEQNLIVQEGENKLALWDWENAQVGKFVTFKKPIEAFYYHPERERVLLSLENGDLQSLDVGDFENQEVKTGFFQAPEKPVFYDLSQDFYINDEGIVRRISNKQNKRIPPETWTRIQSYLASGREATFSIDAPEGVEAEGVFVIDAFGGMRFLDIFEANAQAQTIAAHGQPIRQFIVDAPYIYTFASPKGNQKETPDYALKKWKLGVFEQPVSTFLGSTAPFIGMYKDPDTKTVYTLDQKGKLRIWPESSHSGSTEMLRRDLHIHEITTLPENKRWHFSPSGDVAFVELSSRRWGLHLLEGWILQPEVWYPIPQG